MMEKASENGISSLEIVENAVILKLNTTSVLYAEGK